MDARHASFLAKLRMKPGVEPWEAFVGMAILLQNEFGGMSFKSAAGHVKKWKLMVENGDFDIGTTEESDDI